MGRIVSLKDCVQECNRTLDDTTRWRLLGNYIAVPVLERFLCVQKELFTRECRIEGSVHPPVTTQAAASLPQEPTVERDEKKVDGCDLVDKVSKGEELGLRGRPNGG